MMTNKGFTLVEILISGAILAMAAAIGLMGIDQIINVKTDVTRNYFLDNMISSYVTSIRSNIIMEKIDYDISENSFGQMNTEVDLLKRLPLAWDAHRTPVPKEECTYCEGRIGYSVAPFQNRRGLYIVTLIVYHPQIFALQSNHQRTYKFLVSGP